MLRTMSTWLRRGAARPWMLVALAGAGVAAGWVGFGQGTKAPMSRSATAKVHRPVYLGRGEGGEDSVQLC